MISFKSALKTVVLFCTIFIASSALFARGNSSWIINNWADYYPLRHDTLVYDDVDKLIIIDPNFVVKIDSLIGCSLPNLRSLELRYVHNDFSLVVEDTNVANMIDELYVVSERSFLRDDVFLFKNVKRLKIRILGDVLIPRSILQLDSLKILDIGGSDRTYIPKVICGLHSLEELYAFDNKLSELPVFLIDLNNLCVLDVWYNNISALPKEYDRFVGLDIIVLGNPMFNDYPSRKKWRKKFPNLNFVD